MFTGSTKQESGMEHVEGECHVVSVCKAAQRTVDQIKTNKYKCKSVLWREKWIASVGYGRANQGALVNSTESQSVLSTMLDV